MRTFDHISVNPDVLLNVVGVSVIVDVVVGEVKRDAP